MTARPQVEPAGDENPRTTRVRKIVIEAARDLLIAEGHHAVTAHRVSQVTGVARSTIYRHWPNPVGLLVEAIDSVVAPDHITSTVGDLDLDLSNALGSLRLQLDRRPFRAMFAALLDHARRSPEFAPAQRRFVSGVTSPIHDVVAQAIDDGRLDPLTNPDDAVAQLTGPLFHQHVMLRASISDELIASTVKGFLTSNLA